MKNMYHKSTVKGLALFVAGLFMFSASFVRAADAPVPKTGQMACYAENGTQIDCGGTGQDGDNQAGVEWPTPRFTDNGDGTVTDNLTGLIWSKDSNCGGQKDWDTAFTYTNGLASGACGLSDGSVAGDWRLPNRRELLSLIDDSQYEPALPVGHPFTSWQQSGYTWSSTTYANVPDSAWSVRKYDGYVYATLKSGSYYVWPVRGPDTDGDGRQDHKDNCPINCNPQQSDADADGIGDVCDPNPDCGGCGQPDCEQVCSI